MKKIYNYISYCIYSFIPLYIFLFFYAAYLQNIKTLLVAIILFLIGVPLLVQVIFSKVDNIFVCSYKEVSYLGDIDYISLILTLKLGITLCDKINFFRNLAIIVVLFGVLYVVKIRFKSYMLILLGYKSYLIRDKVVYSKKSKEQLIEFLKKEKHLQIREISNNIYIETKMYNFKKFYCEDFN